MADFYVIVSLALVAIYSAASITRYIDPIGSLLVVLYLVWSVINTYKTNQKNAQDDLSY